MNPKLLFPHKLSVHFDSVKCLSTYRSASSALRLSIYRSARTSPLLKRGGTEGGGLGSGFILLALLLVFLSCKPERQQPLADCQDADAPYSHLDIHDQGRTEACWIYAMLACIEHEQFVKGDSVLLSRQWLMTQCYKEQMADAYLMRQQGTESAPITMRNVGPEVLRLIEKYGLVPYELERGSINESKVLARKLAISVEQAQSLQQLYERTEELFPRFTMSKPTAQGEQSAKYPDANTAGKFYYYSAEYTPKQFAESIMYDQKWQWYTSVPYHQWHETFALPVPDNHRFHEYENLPMNELTEKVMTSLRNGHAVYFEYGDPLPEGGCSSRHAMAIVGLTTDKKGKPLLRCLNSYGRQWGCNGYVMITPEEFQKTMCNVGLLQSEE